MRARDRARAVDDCAGAAVCFGGRRAAICDAQDEDSCGPDAVCRYQLGYSSGLGGESTGICVPACDPLSQAASTGGAACGSVDPAAPALGCFYNRCAPGFAPLFYEDDASMKVIYAGPCAPYDADNTQPRHAAGEPLALAKLPRDAAPTQGHGACEDCRYLWTSLFDGSGLAGPRLALPSVARLWRHAIAK